MLYTVHAINAAGDAERAENEYKIQVVLSAAPAF